MKTSRWSWWMQTAVLSYIMSSIFHYWIKQTHFTNNTAKNVLNSISIFIFEIIRDKLNMHTVSNYKFGYFKLQQVHIFILLVYHLLLYTFIICISCINVVNIHKTYNTEFKWNDKNVGGVPVIVTNTGRMHSPLWRNNCVRRDI